MMLNCIVVKVKSSALKNLKNNQYCIRTWNVKYMSQGKLDVVKQEMARLIIDISNQQMKMDKNGQF